MSGTLTVLSKALWMSAGEGSNLQSQGSHIHSRRGFQFTVAGQSHTQQERVLIYSHRAVIYTAGEGSNLQSEQSYTWQERVPICSHRAGEGP